MSVSPQWLGFCMSCLALADMKRIRVGFLGKQCICIQTLLCSCLKQPSPWIMHGCLNNVLLTEINEANSKMDYEFHNRNYLWFWCLTFFTLVPSYLIGSAAIKSQSECQSVLLRYTLALRLGDHGSPSSHKELNISLNCIWIFLIFLFVLHLRHLGWF